MVLTASDYFSIFNLVVFSVFALFLFVKNYRSKINISLSLTVVATAIWIFTNLMTDLSNTGALALAWSKLTLVGPIFVAYFVLYFSTVFPKERGGISKGIWYLLLLPVVSILFLVPTSLNISSAWINSGQVDVVVGPLYYIFGVYFLCYFGVGIFNLLRSFLNSQGIIKVQMWYVLGGLGLAVFLGLITNFILPIMGVSGLASLGPAFSFIFFLTTGYAIVRHRLLDIRLAIRALIVRLIIVLILGAFFYLTAQLLQSFLAPLTNIGILVSVLLVALFLVLFYEPLANWVRRNTDLVLFQAEYSKAEVLKELGKALSQSLDLASLKEQITQNLQRVLKAKWLKFELGPMLHNPIADELRVNLQPLVYDELIREVEEMPEGAQKTRKRQVVEGLRKEEIAVALPLISQAGFIGMMTLGEKMGSDAYTSTDLDILETLMYQMATALENASLFSEVSDFNLKLKTEVEKATKDLAEKNRNLSVLRRLDEIIINTLDLDEICQKIVDTIAWEAGFLGGMICLLDEESGHLVAKALSQTPVLSKVIPSLPGPLPTVFLDLKNNSDHPIIQSLVTRRAFASSSFIQLFSPPLSSDLCSKLQTQTKINNLLVYPLSSKGRPLGVIVFALHKPFEELNSEETNILGAFMDEAGIAIENTKLYNDLRLANEHLMELDRMKDELVSVASHELRTPMTSIKSYLWMIINKKGTLPSEKKDEYIDRAYESSERMIKLVEDMLTVSRIEGGKIEIHLAPSDLTELINQVVADLSVQAQAKGAELVFLQASSKLPLVLMDVDRTREVLVNLVGNALKYTPNKGKIDISVSEKDGWIEVSVHDSGKKISKEDLPRLFQKFGRLEGSFVSSAEAGGTGLGLYITKGLVELQGGRIWVDTEVKIGTSFVFTLKKV